MMTQDCMDADGPVLVESPVNSTADSKIVSGPRAAVERHIHSLGLRLGERDRKVVDVVDRKNVYGDYVNRWFLEDADGNYAGLFMAFQRDWSAVIDGRHYRKG